MKKYLLIAFIIHMAFFFKIHKKNTLGQSNISLKKTIPISYNVKNRKEKNDSVKATKKVSTQKEESPKKEELKKVEKKIIEQIPKSKMNNNKKTEKKVTEKNSQTKKISNLKKEKLSTEPLENNLNKNIVANIDGTYTALSSKGIDFEILYQVDPNYPKQAEMIRYKNTVTIGTKFLVGLDGKIEKIEILKPFEKFGFDKEVTSALKKWKFKPIFYEGKNIKVYFYKDFIFTPKK